MSSYKNRGYTDHIHILCMLSKKIALMNLLEEVKSHSSKWMKTKGTELKNFYWQNGYGAFSVNPTEIDKVITYIENQKEHHRKKTFQEEYRAFLKKYKVEYDEKFVWDWSLCRPFRAKYFSVYFLRAAPWVYIFCPFMAKRVQNNFLDKQHDCFMKINKNIFTQLTVKYN